MTTVTRIDFATDDRDEAADAIENAFGFRARFNVREFGFRQQTLFGRDVSFTELRFGADLRTDVDPNPSFVVSEIPRGRYTITRGRDSIDLSHGGLFLLPTGSSMRVELDHTVTRTYNLGTVEHVRQVVLETAPESAGLDLSRLRPVSPGAERYLRDSLGLYRRHFLTGEPTAGLASEQAYRHLLMTAVSVFGLVSPQHGALRESAVVRRARAHVEEHLGEPLTVGDLAAAAHTGVRALQLAFRRELGQSPMDYVRDTRLAAARADLQTGGCPDPASPCTAFEPMTVSAVARRWGFVNAGRFSSLYYRRFGEYPSDTLRRR